MYTPHQEVPNRYTTCKGLILLLRHYPTLESGFDKVMIRNVSAHPLSAIFHTWSNRSLY